MSFSPIHLLLGFGLLQGIVLIALLLFLAPLRQNKSNIILIGLMFMIIGNVGQYWLLDTAIIDRYTLQIIYLPYLLGIAPLFIMYAYSLKIFDHFPYRRAILFLPFFLSLGLHIVLKFLIFGRGSVEIIRNPTVQFLFFAEEIIAIIYCLVSAVIVYRLVQKGTNYLGNSSFGINRKLAQWLLLMMRIGLAIALVWIVSLGLAYNQEKGLSIYYGLWGAMLTGLIILGSGGLYFQLKGFRIVNFNLVPNDNDELSHLADNEKLTVRGPEGLKNKSSFSNILTLNELLSKKESVQHLQNTIESWINDHLGYTRIKWIDDYNPYHKYSDYQYLIPFSLNQGNGALGVISETRNEEEMYLLNLATQTYSFHHKRVKKKNKDKDVSEKYKHLYSSLISLLDDEKLYTDPEIDLQKVAHQLGISKGYLSKVINSHTSQSFNDLINDYRIKLTKKIMADEAYEHYSVTSYGLEAGFNSKSTFYKAFRERERISPGQYLQQIKNSSVDEDG